MTSLTDIFIKAFHSPDSLTAAIHENAEGIILYFNATGSYLDDDMEQWRRLILSHKSVLNRLDYTDPYVRSFIVSLLDYACRFGDQSMVRILHSITRSHGILIGSRLEAECLIYCPRPSHSIEFLKRFQKICGLLDTALEDGETCVTDVKAALLSYYRHVLENLSAPYISQFRDMVAAEVPVNNVAALIGNEVSDTSMTPQRLYAVIDELLQHNDAPAVARSFGVLLVEEGTPYASYLGYLPPSFPAIRNLAKSMAPANTTLGMRGTEIIRDTDDLAVYMRNYGNMHYAKIASALEPPFPAPGGKVDLIDWGCGQAIASMAYIGRFGADAINMIVLIDPSELSLRRAALHCCHFAPGVPIVTICSDFDSLRPEMLPPPTSPVCVNLFSNVLDMPSFSHSHLISVVESARHPLNHFVCASPATDDTAIMLLDSFMAHFRTSHSKFTLHHTENDTKYSPYWMCNNRYQYGNPRHGCNDYCSQYTEEGGCFHKWTRLLRVFSTE